MIRIVGQRWHIVKAGKCEKCVCVGWNEASHLVGKLLVFPHS